MGVTLPYTYLQDLEAEITQSMDACLARVLSGTGRGHCRGARGTVSRNR